MAFWGDNFRRGVLNLRVVAPSGEARVLVLDKPELKIGSARDSDLVLDDPCVAANHCRLVVLAGGLELRDRGSRFGTTVNLQRCTQPTRIVEGDRVGVGAYVLELMPARVQADIDAVARRVRHADESWDRDPDEALRRQLDQSAAAWDALRRPRRLLPPAPRLVRAVALDARAPLGPLTRAWLTVAARRRRVGQGLRWGLSGALLGLALATPIVASTPSEPPPEPPAQPASPAPAPAPAPPPAALPVHTHTVVPGDTPASLARAYNVQLRWIEQWNGLEPGAPLTPGAVLRIEAARAPLARAQVLHVAEAGDTWETLARRLGVDPQQLRADNPYYGDTLRSGDRITFWAPAPAPAPAYEPAALEVPTGAYSTGGANVKGTLVDALRLPPSTDYELRCPFNAHASSFTTDRLLAAISALRVHYRGQIVIGDVSREDGGSFGHHASHQSGRDVDLWLPRRGGYYRQADECASCGTRWCRPDPDEVDWSTTWALVTALRDTDAVQNIFLDRSLHQDLRAAARAAGLTDDEVLAAIPRRATADALVTHSDRHTHHIHVRFRCGPEDLGCRP
jgi:murein endopeptidase/LysM repeat protein